MSESDELISQVLKKLKGPLLSAAEVLPSNWTSDIYKLEAEKCYEAREHWLGFHYLSLTHCHLIQHRVRQKISHKLQKQSTENSENESMNYLEVDLDSESMDKTQQRIQSLPSDWTIVQITSCGISDDVIPRWQSVETLKNSPSIYISRALCGSSPSLLVQKVRPSTCEQKSIPEEVTDILKENEIIASYYQGDLQKYTDKKEEINNRMKAVVRNMSVSWLKGWSSLLIGSLPPREEQELSLIVKKAVKSVEAVMDDDQIEKLKLLVSAPNAEESSYNLRSAIAVLMNESVRDATVRQLSAIFRKDTNLQKIRNTTRNPVILILDKDIVTLPWEMVTVIVNQPVTRMPNLSSLAMLYKLHSTKPDSVLVKGVNPRQGFYILDPENNLPRTQKRLKSSFSATTWKGVVGQKPTMEVFCDGLKNQDISVYVGHGCGTQYVPYRAVEAIDCHSLVLLYGCSSIAMKKRGKIADPWGTVINYLVAFCPCIVGMQWNVMDKDTDILTSAMICAISGKCAKGTPLEDPPSDIPLLVAKARPLCSWYLISAALIVYGLPVHVLNHNNA